MAPIRDHELTLRDLFRIYRRRRRIIFATVISAALICALYCALCTRRYQATGIIQIQSESADGLGLASLLNDATAPSDALQASIAIQTQATILQSNTLGLRAIHNLHLEETEDFRPRWSPLGSILNLLSPKGAPDKAGVDLTDAPQRRVHALSVLGANLKVKSLPGTKLIEVSYLNPDPHLATSVVNEMMSGIVDYNFQTRYNTTSQTSTWLTGQLTELRRQTEDLQGKVVALERESGVYSLGTVDSQGHEQAYSGVLDQLQQATMALTQAQQNRILKGAIATAAKAGNAEMLSGLAGNSLSASGGSSSVANSLTLIQNLRQQEATQQATLQSEETKFGASYPKLIELRAAVAGLQRSIQEENERIKGRAESDYSVAVETEARTRDQFQRSKQQADALNDKAIEYVIVRQEADQSRSLYEDLLKRLKEAGVLEGLKSSNITVVDPGRVPAKPKTPNVPIFMVASFAIGIILGTLLALLIHALDNRLSNISEVEELTGHGIIGALPYMDKLARTAPSEEGSPLTTIGDPHSTFSEAIRSVRTALLLTGGADTSRVILVTSSIPNEGKTTFSANLAVVLAQLNRKVLLVDLDMRRGALRRNLVLPHSSGLSELLAGQKSAPEMVSIDGIPHLDVLLSGPPPPNPSELLDRSINHWLCIWRERYDFIVLDGTPVLPVTDALIVNPRVDITVLMARASLTERAQLERSYGTLVENSKHFVGVVLNCLRADDDSYYGYYGYRNYSHHYGGGDDAGSK